MLNFFQLAKQELNSYSFFSMRSQVAMRCTVAVIVAIFFGLVFDFSSPQWLGISAFIVIQLYNGSTIKKALQRISSTLIAFTFTLLVFKLSLNSIFISIILGSVITTICFYMIYKSNKDYTFIMLLITFVLLFYTSLADISASHLMQYCQDRVLETIAGSIIACVVFYFWPNYATNEINNSSQKMLSGLKDIINDIYDLYDGKIKIKPTYTAYDQILDLQSDFRMQAKYESTSVYKDIAYNKQCEEFSRVIYDSSKGLINHFNIKYIMPIDNSNAVRWKKLHNSIIAIIEHLLQKNNNANLFNHKTIKAERLLDNTIRQLDAVRQSGYFLDKDVNMKLQIERCIMFYKQVIMSLKAFDKQTKEEKIVKSDLFSLINLFDKRGQNERFLWVQFSLNSILMIIAVYVCSQFNTPQYIVNIALLFSLNLFVSRQFILHVIIAYLIVNILVMLIIKIAITSLFVIMILSAPVIYWLGYYLVSDNALFRVVGIIGFTSFIYPLFEYKMPPIYISDMLVSNIAFLASMAVLWLFSYVTSREKSLIKHHLFNMRHFEDEIEGYLYVLYKSKNDKTKDKFSTKIKQNIARMKFTELQLKKELNANIDRNNKQADNLAENIQKTYLAYTDLLLAGNMLSLATTLENDIPDFLDLYTYTMANKERGADHINVILGRLINNTRKGCWLPYETVLYGMNMLYSMKHLCKIKKQQKELIQTILRN